MDHRQALEAFGHMRARAIRRVWRAAEPVAVTGLRPGLYLGRNGGMAALPTWVARNVVGRDWFAKLVLDGWGVNVRVRQDGTWTPRPSKRVAGGPKVDLPFRLDATNLDYRVHLAGMDFGTGHFLRDFLRVLSIGDLATMASDRVLEAAGARRDEAHDDGELLIGVMAPLGLRALAVTPFAISFDHAPTPVELEAAEAYVRRRRVVDTGRGPAGMLALPR